MQCGPLLICSLRSWQINRGRTPFQHDLITLLIRAGEGGGVGLSSGPETIASEPWLVRRFFHESEMALLFECTQECAPKELDTAGIIRDGDLSPREHCVATAT